MKQIQDDLQVPRRDTFRSLSLRERVRVRGEHGGEHEAKKPENSERI
jgi:hypothetical protein